VPEQDDRDRSPEENRQAPEEAEPHIASETGLHGTPHQRTALWFIHTVIKAIA
jgi:hypothetical protein